MSQSALKARTEKQSPPLPLGVMNDRTSAHSCYQGVRDQQLVSIIYIVPGETQIFTTLTASLTSFCNDDRGDGGGELDHPPRLATYICSTAFSHTGFARSSEHGDDVRASLHNAPYYTQSTLLLHCSCPRSCTFALALAVAPLEARPSVSTSRSATKLCAYAEGLKQVDLPPLSP